jgi:hypothetical protein
MKGQWIGTFSGNNTGTIIVNMDELEDHFEGTAFLHFQDIKLPIASATLSTTGKMASGSISVSLTHLDPATYAPLSMPELSSRYPELVFPTRNRAIFLGREISQIELAHFDRYAGRGGADGIQGRRALGISKRNEDVARI